MIGESPRQCREVFYTHGLELKKKIIHPPSSIFLKSFNCCVLCLVGLSGFSFKGTILGAMQHETRSCLK